jgi:hypothetical protein
MTITPIFDDLTTDGGTDEAPTRRTLGGGIVVTAGRRPSPVPRRRPVPRPEPAHATAFGQGCLDDDRDAGDDPRPDAAPAEGGLPHLLEAARREAEVLGHRRVGTEHLLLAVVRAGGEVGRAFGLRRVGVAVVAAACAAAPVPEPLVAPDGTSAPTAAARAALLRARRRATERARPAAAADLGLALLDAGRSARLLADLGVDRDDLADVLARDDLAVPAVPAVRADVRPRVPAPVPVGTLAPVRLMLPSPSGTSSTVRTGAVTAPLRVGPPPGSPARRLGLGRVEPVARADEEPALDLPA